MQKEHIRAGVHRAQRAVHLERIHPRLHIEALRQHRLKYIAGGNVLLGSFHAGNVVLFRGAKLHLELAVLARLLRGQRWQGSCEPHLQLVEPLWRARA